MGEREREREFSAVKYDALTAQVEDRLYKMRFLKIKKNQFQVEDVLLCARVVGDTYIITAYVLW